MSKTNPILKQLVIAGFVIGARLTFQALFHENRPPHPDVDADQIIRRATMLNATRSCPMARYPTFLRNAAPSDQAAIGNAFQAQPALKIPEIRLNFENLPGFDPRQLMNNTAKLGTIIATPDWSPRP